MSLKEFRCTFWGLKMLLSLDLECPKGHITFPQYVVALIIKKQNCFLWFGEEIR